MKYDDIIKLPKGTELYTSGQVAQFEFGNVSPYTKCHILRHIDGYIGVIFDSGECANKEGWYDKYDVETDLISKEEYDALAANNFGRCNYCYGDEAILWIDDQNNAFIDSAGEMTVMAKRKALRLTARLAMLCVV